MAEDRQLQLFTDIIDETEKEVLTFRYEIANYGADYPVDSLVKRINSRAIFVPPFQRRYVWNIYEASKFIESLLLGLPVPGIFLSKERETNRLLIVDGQQRLLTLSFFYQKKFKDESEFKLTGVQSDLEGKTYDDLSQSDKNRLDDSIIHSTIIKQEEPDDDDSSIYQIFERINSGGRPLSPQEIRACIYYGKFNELLVELATHHSTWRRIIEGEHNDRLKEEELILRFFALLYGKGAYNKPMKDFLNKFMAANKNFEKYSKDEMIKVFNTTIEYIDKALGNTAFRYKRGIHSAIFDSVMVGTAIRLSSGKEPNTGLYRNTYMELLDDSNYRRFYTAGTSDDNSVEGRILIATEYFSKVA